MGWFGPLFLPGAGTLSPRPLDSLAPCLSQAAPLSLHDR